MASKILEQQGRTNEAELILEGARFLGGGDAVRAESSWRRAVQKNPQCLAAWACISDLLITQQRFAEADACLKHLIAGCSGTVGVLAALAEKSWQIKRFDQARMLANEALQRKPPLEIDRPLTLLLAKLDYMAEDWEAARDRSSTILVADENNVDALKIRQKCWKQLLYAEEDAVDTRLLVRLQPSALYHSDLLFLMNFLPDTTPEKLYEESQRWNNLYAAPLATKVIYPVNTPDPNRRLKIGYVSADFRNHPIMKLLPAVFEKYNEQQFEVFVYSVNDHEDDVTSYVRRTIPNFIELPLDREKISSRVRADEIDILVDLAGHTQPLEALMAFAFKPAPVQVSWMGVHATTGMTTMDYFLGDAEMPCPGTEHLFTEAIYRLKHAQYCYRPFGDPGLVESPCLTNGFITFGCFNKPRKITHEMVRMWSVILRFHSTSKLFLKYGGYERASVRERIINWFAEDGIPAERLLFACQSDAVEFLASLNTVDIALDTYPYNGGTTTLDTLWMGVPIVALRGRLAVSRCSASFLSALGLPVADTPEQYISLANELIEAIKRAPDFRRQIRNALLRSALMDEQGLVNALEDAYRAMWLKWCASQVQLI